MTIFFRRLKSVIVVFTYYRGTRNNENVILSTIKLLVVSIYFL